MQDITAMMGGQMQGAGVNETDPQKQAIIDRLLREGITLDQISQQPEQLLAEGVISEAELEILTA